MIDRQIESPIPMPLDLVVKKGLNSRSAFSAENPTPQSVTLTRTCWGSSWLDRITCVYRKLNPNVLMMKSAQDGVRIYGAGSLNRTKDRRILLQRPMRSNAFVVGRIVFQNSAQMCLA